MLTAKYFEEPDCGPCAAVRNFALLPFADKLHIDEIDVAANTGEDISWYRSFCRERFGREVVPLIKIRGYVICHERSIGQRELAEWFKEKIGEYLKKLEGLAAAPEWPGVFLYRDIVYRPWRGKR